MHESIASNDLQLVGEDEFCAKCGYNLRTLNKAGTCPECGAPVATSLGKKPFRGASRRWLISVAAGLALLIFAYLLTAGAVGLASEPHDRFAVLLTLAPAGARLWIIARFLQMNFNMAAKSIGMMLLLVHLGGILAISKPAPSSSPAERWLRIFVRILALAAPVFWLFYAWEWGPFSPSKNDVLEPAMVCASFYDVMVVIATGLLLAGIAVRGGYRRAAILIVLLMVLQAAGMALLFCAVYLREFFHFVSEDNLIWPGLSMNAAAGLVMTLALVFLIYKLWMAARRA